MPKPCGGVRETFKMMLPTKRVNKKTETTSRLPTLEAEAALLGQGLTIPTINR